MADGQRTASSDYLDVLAKVAALAAVLLPAAGVATRWAAFTFGPPAGAPLELAASAPLAQLVVTGLLSLLPLVVTAIASTYLIGVSHLLYRQSRLGQSIRRLRREYNASEAAAVPTSGEDPEAFKQRVDTLMRDLNEQIDGVERDAKELDSLRQAQPGWIRRLVTRGPPRPKWLWLAVPILLLGLISIPLVPAWPAPLVGYLLSAAGTALFMLAGSRTTPLTLRQLWPWVVTLMFLASIAAGWEGGGITGTAIRHFSFASGAPIPAGRYVPLAQEGDMVFLQSCQGADKAIVAVHESAIESIQLETAVLPLPPSLWEIRFGGRHFLGFGRASFC